MYKRKYDKASRKAYRSNTIERLFLRSLDLGSTRSARVSYQIVKAELFLSMKKDFMHVHVNVMVFFVAISELSLAL